MAVLMISIHALRVGKKINKPPTEWPFFFLFQHTLTQYSYVLVLNHNVQFILFYFNYCLQQNNISLKIFFITIVCFPLLNINWNSRVENEKIKYNWVNIIKRTNHCRNDKKKKFFFRYLLLIINFNFIS